MKSFLKTIVIAIIGCCVCVSCGKEESCIDDLVGAYSVNLEENVVWGNSSGTTYDSGVMVITKLSASKVKLSGFISALGEVVGNKLYLESQTHMSNLGYHTTTYSEGLFALGFLTIRSSIIGQLAATANGTLYPYRSICYLEARKIGDIENFVEFDTNNAD